MCVCVDSVCTSVSCLSLNVALVCVGTATLPPSWSGRLHPTLDGPTGVSYCLCGKRVLVNVTLGKLLTVASELGDCP